MGQTVCVLQILSGSRSDEIIQLMLEYAARMDPEDVRLDFYVCGAVPEKIRERAAQYGGQLYAGPRISAPFAKQTLTAFLRQHTEYRIAHVHLEEHSAAALEAARRAGIPVRICHAHGPRNPQDRSLYVPSAEARIGRAATVLFADCITVGERLYGVGNLEREIVLPPFVDGSALRWNLHQRKTIRGRRNIDSRTLVIGCLDPLLTKGELEHGLNIVHRVSKEFPRVHLLVAEALRSYEPLFRRAVRRGLAVSFAEDTASVLPAADVCLFPGSLMRIPYALIQAQAAGVPCVVSDRVPREGILSPLSCSLYCHRPVSQWAQYVLMAAAQPRNAGQAEWVSQYDIRRGAAWLERLYWEEGQCGKPCFIAPDEEKQRN